MKESSDFKTQLIPHMWDFKSRDVDERSDKHQNEAVWPSVATCQVNPRSASQNHPKKLSTNVV